MIICWISGSLFPDPHQFLPDPWLAPDTGQAHPRRGSFLPFGTGAARCLGEEFGLAEAALILSSLIARG